MTIHDDGIHVDFAGTSPASAYGINVVLNYTTAYTAFGIKCVVAPEVPNNAGSLEPLTVSAPEGCILNVKRPWAVAARHTVGHMLPDLVFGCLHQVMPGRVPAEGASSLWNPQIYGGGSAPRAARPCRRAMRSGSSCRVAAASAIRAGGWRLRLPTTSPTGSSRARRRSATTASPCGRTAASTRRRRRNCAREKRRRNK